MSQKMGHDGRCPLWVKRQIEAWRRRQQRAVQELCDRQNAADKLRRELKR